jgi:hypothetical protein
MSERRWLVYCLAEEGFETVGPCKIGMTVDMPKRLSSLQGGNWRPLIVVWTIAVPTREMARRIEDYCLSFLRPSIYGGGARKQLKSEWVDGSPAEARVHADRLYEAYVSEGDIAA